jgi:hypothetical protein
MFRDISRLIDRPIMKITLIVMGLYMTLAIGQAIAIGMFGAIISLTNPSIPFQADILIVVLGALLGYCSAWARVLLTGPRLCRRPRLRWAICLGLLSGILVASSLIFRIGPTSWNPMPQLYLSYVVVGCILLISSFHPHDAPAA